jgi:hypothetical protein
VPALARGKQGWGYVETAELGGLAEQPGGDLLRGARRLIAAGKSRTNLTYSARVFRSDLLIQNELALKCTSFRAGKIFSFSPFRPLKAASQLPPPLKQSLGGPPADWRVPTLFRRGGKGWGNQPIPHPSGAWMGHPQCQICPRFKMSAMCPVYTPVTPTPSPRYAIPPYLKAKGLRDGPCLGPYRCIQGFTKVLFSADPVEEAWYVASDKGEAVRMAGAMSG